MTTTATRSRSEEIYQNLCAVTPGGVNSPVRAFPGMETTPLVVDMGKGDTIRDVDGRHYIDFCSSWGALILGHADPGLVDTVQLAVSHGTSFGITTPSEERIAEKMVSMVPALEQVRFVSSGTEATMSAVRLARGYTGRNIVVKFDGNYHGHADAFLVAAGSGVTELGDSSSAGIPAEAVQHTVSLPYNDCAAVRTFFQENERAGDVAAVILEPIAGNMGVVPATLEFLQVLREETQRVGALLIFDEVMSGFRVARGGAQELYGMAPDLSCFGKVMGGGFPAAAFGGRKEIMAHLAPLGSVYQAGTLSGNPIAMTAGHYVLEQIDDVAFYRRIKEKTELLTRPIREAIEKLEVPACIQEVPGMFTLFFGVRSVKNQEQAKATDGERFKRFFQYMLERGVYIPPSQFEAWFIMEAHSDDHLSQVADAVIDFLKADF